MCHFSMDYHDCKHFKEAKRVAVFLCGKEVIIQRGELFRDTKPAVYERLRGSSLEYYCENARNWWNDNIDVGLCLECIREKEYKETCRRIQRENVARMERRKQREREKRRAEREALRILGGEGADGENDIGGRDENIENRNIENRNIENRNIENGNMENDDTSEQSFKPKHRRFGHVITALDEVAKELEQLHQETRERAKEVEFEIQMTGPENFEEQVAQFVGARDGWDKGSASGSSVWTDEEVHSVSTSIGEEGELNVELQDPGVDRVNSDLLLDSRMRD